MFRSLYVAATGMDAMVKELEDITNNIANAQTVGFKKGRVELESLFYVQKSFGQELIDALSRREMYDTPPVGVEFGSGVRVAATPKDYSQGAIEVTNNQLDLAIDGDGFFMVTLPDGSEAYSRAGNFNVDSENNLVTTSGYLVYPNITLPEGTTAVTIRTDGTVLASTYNSTSQEEVGQLNLATFTNPAGLKSLGQNLYAATVASGEATQSDPGIDGCGQVVQFALEKSNVDVLTEMMRMVSVQRVFDVLTKATSATDEMLAKIERMKS